MDKPDEPELIITQEFELDIITSAHRYISNRKGSKLKEKLRQRRYRDSAKGKATAARSRAKRSTNPRLREKHNEAERNRHRRKRAHQRAAMRELLAMLPPIELPKITLADLPNPPRRLVTSEVGLPTTWRPVAEPRQAKPTPQPAAPVVDFESTDFPPEPEPVFTQVQATPTQISTVDDWA